MFYVKVMQFLMRNKTVKKFFNYINQEKNNGHFLKNMPFARGNNYKRIWKKKKKLILKLKFTRFYN